MYNVNFDGNTDNVQLCNSIILLSKRTIIPFVIDDDNKPNNDGCDDNKIIFFSCNNAVIIVNIFIGSNTRNNTVQLISDLLLYDIGNEFNYLFEYIQI